LLEHLTDLSVQVGWVLGGRGVGLAQGVSLPPWPLLALCVLLQRDCHVFRINPVLFLLGGDVWKLRASIMCPCW
jgi:hypothetical protein